MGAEEGSVSVRSLVLSTAAVDVCAHAESARNRGTTLGARQSVHDMIFVLVELLVELLAEREVVVFVVLL
jgi:hypothetical protein